MISTETAIVVDYNKVLSRFCELTNWSSAHLGGWNADLSKEVVFHPELVEETLQYEQDWMCFYYPDNYEEVTVDKTSLLDDSQRENYEKKDILFYTIPLGAILKWLVLNGELPETGEFLVKN